MGERAGFPGGVAKQCRGSDGEGAENGALNAALKGYEIQVTNTDMYQKAGLAKHGN